MRNLQFTGSYNGKQITLQQISKQAAKKLFANNETIYLQSSNIHPFGMWQGAYSIQLDKEQLQSDINHNNFCIDLYSKQVENFTNNPEVWSQPLITEYAEKVKMHKSKIIDANYQFDTLISNYSYYNCDNERGKYITYYKAI